MLLNICSPSLGQSRPGCWMCSHSPSEDHFSYYCSGGILAVIKRIPYTPLAKLICSLFSFQAGIKSRFGLGFLALNFLFPFIFFPLHLRRLYVSPKKQVADPGPESPLKWCRQALDHRSPETEMACRTLISRLDQSKAFNETMWWGKKKLGTMNKVQIEPRGGVVPSLFLFTAHISFCATQTPFIMICPCCRLQNQHNTHPDTCSERQQEAVTSVGLPAPGSNLHLKWEAKPKP